MVAEDGEGSIILSLRGFGEKYCYSKKRAFFLRKPERVFKRGRRHTPGENKRQIGGKDEQGISVHRQHFMKEPWESRTTKATGGLN